MVPFRLTAITTGGLVTTTLLTSGTGFVFWWIAARLFAADAVGLGGAAVSAIIFLSQVSELGLGTKLAGVLHLEHRRGALAVTALLATGLAGALLGLAFAALAPALFRELMPLAATAAALFLFVSGVALSAIASVLDQVLASVFHNLYRLLRNAVFSFGRLALLPLAAMLFAQDGIGILGAWVGGIAISLGVLGAFAHRAMLWRRVRPLSWIQLGGMARDSMSHHVLNLSRGASLWLLPVIVTVMLSAEVNASFYVALLLSNFVALMASSATFSLYIVGARTPDLLWQQIRFTLLLSAAASVVGTTVLAFAGRPLLAVFGEGYAAGAYPAVVVLALTTVPLLVKDHWIALERIRGTVRAAARVGVATLLLELLAAVLGAQLAGVEGLALARLVVVSVQAAFMAPAVMRALGRQPLAPSAGISSGSPGVDEVGVGR